MTEQHIYVYMIHIYSVCTININTVYAYSPTSLHLAAGEM